MRAVSDRSLGVSGWLDPLSPHPAQVFLHHRRLARKVLVEGAFRYRRFTGQALDAGGIDPVPIEEPGGCLEDALARAATAASLALGLLLLTCHSSQVYRKGLPSVAILLLSGSAPKYTGRFTSGGCRDCARRTDRAGNRSQSGHGPRVHRQLLDRGVARVCRGKGPARHRRRRSAGWCRSRWT